MPQDHWLVERFQEHRGHLRRVAYRMLGSSQEADDALQEAWLRVSQADAGQVGNLGGWLTTVVARVCLDMLRLRGARREAPLDAGPSLGPERAVDTERDLLLADSIGPALLVVLETLGPAERVAFVLHDMFDVSFDEIAEIVGRSPEAARQLASRARRRIRGGPPVSGDLERQRKVVDAFLAASRGGNFEALLAVLDPDVRLRADPIAVQTAAANHWSELTGEIQGARAVAGLLQGRARGLKRALVDGHPGGAWMMGGQLRGAWAFTLAGDRISGIELIMEPERLARTQVELDPGEE
jgi:RNA polymerase sigma factor (sigma-70 family)